MPLTFVDISAASYLPFSTVRQTIKDCIDFTIGSGVSGARVYAHWVYEIDVASMLGKVTGAMRCIAGTDIGKVHCWTIGIEKANWELTNGTPDVLGARNSQWAWDIDLSIWGFFDNDGTPDAQAKAENEARLVSASLWRNADIIRTSNSLWSELRPLTFSNIGPTPFSDGNSYAVAS